MLYFNELQYFLKSAIDFECLAIAPDINFLL